ncbi:MAG TPA: transcription antitermination factor NusB [Gammaproteobacteria bacterium]|jgi:N utilization substance protein B|nr:transcription antitermination factor NusB [Gammaproteobacteria bacterium]
MAGKPQGARARAKARRLALQGLYQWQLSGTPAGELVAELNASQNVKDVDADYFEALLRGVIADSDALQALFQPHLDRPAGQVDPIERGILLIGSFELKERIDVPYRVVLNEAMELAKGFGAEDSHKYINAVLDKTSAGLRQAERAAR